MWLILLNLIMSFSFMFLNHPMTMGLLLLTQTITVALITGTLALNFWFSYIIFLIMVGGMLVLFIYMTSIASNEMFNMSMNLIIISTMMTFIFFIMYFIIDPFYYSMSQTLLESNLINYKDSNNYNLSKFFNYPSMFVVFFMIIYLFITMIAVVKITKIEYGPLRHYT
uniref:NADH-ubiquinone oxidoreductase chain 6 n=1 Tax=Staphylinidae sp. BMNH 1274661 TaxID=1796588 RepID=A0A126TFX0_9COLE|nr:NADH dehydrogenase subunit 6 [Staphylinidae sp. BMNH 1274661]